MNTVGVSAATSRSQRMSSRGSGEPLHVHDVRLELPEAAREAAHARQVLQSLDEEARARARVAREYPPADRQEELVAAIADRCGNGPERKGRSEQIDGVPASCERARKAVVVRRRRARWIDDGDTHGGDDTSVTDLASESGQVRVKHALDRTLALGALVAFSPALAAIGIWILARQRAAGAVLAPARRQERPRVSNAQVPDDGADAIALNQAMNISEDPYGHLPDDPRITRSGRFLRRTSLDELPQLVNVLRGEMSLVGPRADIVEQVANYSGVGPAPAGRSPGITGWAQVNGRDAIPWPKRFELDAWYIENWSLSLDAKIVRADGARAVPRRGPSRSSTR